MAAGADTGLAARGAAEAERSSYPDGFPEDISVAAGRYCDPAFHALERRFVFETTWLYAGNARLLPRPGAYLRLDAFADMGHPLMLVRGKDGLIRAFYNVCQHRGAPLVTEPSGALAGRMVCGYHAWTYGLDGDLMGFPEAKNFPRQMKEQCIGLRQVECDLWGDLIFVRVRPGPHSLLEFLQPVASEIDGLIGDQAAEVHFAGSRSLDLACDWKMLVDANIETYHVPFVHRHSAARALDEAKTAQWLLPRGHSRMLIAFRTPLPATLPLPSFGGDTGSARLGVYSFHLFPNLSIVFGGPTSCFLIAASPRGPGRSRYDVHFLSAADPDGPLAEQVRRSVEDNWQILLEDMGLLAASQRGVESGAIERMRLQYQERRIRYLHEEIDRTIGAHRISPELRAPALLDTYVEAS